MEGHRAKSREASQGTNDEMLTFNFDVFYAHSIN
jgi:hypothetical protein